MIHDLKPYPAMKDSGVPWVGQVPEHWDVQRGKRLFQKMNRPVDETAETVTCFRDGVVTLRKNRRLRGFTEALKEIGYQGVKRGDLVIHAMDAFAGAIGVSDSDGKATPVYAVCTPREDAVPEYYAYVTRQMAQTQWILALSRGIRERSTDFRFEAFGNQSLPVPPQDEQAAIVRFLEHADRRIRKAIAAKQKLIKLLQEQKQVIIHQAVTRGLDPNVKLKPSGVEWLGDIPEGWTLSRLKAVCLAIVDCKNRTPDQVDDGEYTVVRTTNIRNGSFNLEGSFQTDLKNFKIWTERGAPQEGDVFFTREAPVGEACLVPAGGRLCMGQRMMYFRPNPAYIDSQFLLHSIYGPTVRKYMDVELNGSTVGHLRLGQVASIPLLLPSVTEQESIVKFIDTELAALNAAIQRANQEITLLREYRTRLIADVVTGKLDVRDAAAQLPELTDEALPAELDDAEDAETDELDTDGAED